MFLMILLKGILIGLAIAAPIGPIGLLCIQRTLSIGFIAGLVSGLGATAADGIYSVIVGFSITEIIELLIRYQNWIRFLGGLLLIYFGLQLILSKNDPRKIRVQKKSLWHYFISTFLFTLTSPVTILLFLAMFASFNLVDNSSRYGDIFSLITGIILGSMLWWFSLCGSVAFILHQRIHHQSLILINRISGMVILGFALMNLVQAILKV